MPQQPPWLQHQQQDQHESVQRRHRSRPTADARSRSSSVEDIDRHHAGQGPPVPPHYPDDTIMTLPPGYYASHQQQHQQKQQQQQQQQQQRPHPSPYQGHATSIAMPDPVYPSEGYTSSSGLPPDHRASPSAADTSSSTAHRHSTRPHRPSMTGSRSPMSIPASQSRQREHRSQRPDPMSSTPPSPRAMSQDRHQYRPAQREYTTPPRQSHHRLRSGSSSRVQSPGPGRPLLSARPDDQEQERRSRTEESRSKTDRRPHHQTKPHQQRDRTPSKKRDPQRPSGPYHRRRSYNPYRTLKDPNLHRTWVSPVIITPEAIDRWQKTKQDIIDWWRCLNLARSLLLLTYIVVNAVLLGTAINTTLDGKYDAMHDFMPAWSLAFSRGAAPAISFNSALLAFLMCRHTLNWLRCKFSLFRWISIEDHKRYHKLVGKTLAFFVVLHVFGHIVNATNIRRNNVGFQYGMMRPSDNVNDTVVHPAIVTGILVTAILFAMTLTGFAFFRRRHFVIFWNTHQLFLLYYLFLGIHGSFCFLKQNMRSPEGIFTPVLGCVPPVAWCYFIGPFLLYLMERAHRFYHGSVLAKWIGDAPRHFITGVVHHPSNVVEIQFRPPLQMSRPGGYIFINVPSVSWLEWHPFTVTSEPSMAYSSIHIRTTGDWTKRVGALLAPIQQEENDEAEGLQTAYDRHRSRKRNTLYKIPKAPVIQIDGPFATVTDDVFDSEVAVLIGGGIGVTPCASVLRGLKASEKFASHARGLQALYFFWIIRDLGSLEWFDDLLAEIEADESLNQILSIHVYFTGKLNEDQLRHVKINAALKMQTQIEQLPIRPLASSTPGQAVPAHKKLQLGVQPARAYDEELLTRQGVLTASMAIDVTDNDPITGLLTPTFYGRPLWSAIFADLHQRHLHQDVDVFFCGPAPMVPSIQKAAATQQLKRSKQAFRFHKESF